MIQFIEQEIMHKFSLEDMLALNPRIIDINERVPEINGKAIDFLSWYGKWTKLCNQGPLDQPTHLTVEAVDEFCATIAWAELKQAALLFEQDSRPLVKGFPLRLFVPDGSSACLNVKSVVKFEFIHAAGLDTQATYGFKNKVSIEDLKKK